MVIGAGLVNISIGLGGECSVQLGPLPEDPSTYQTDGRNDAHQQNTEQDRVLDEGGALFVLLEFANHLQQLRHRTLRHNAVKSCRRCFSRHALRIRLSLGLSQYIHRSMREIALIARRWHTWHRPGVAHLLFSSCPTVGSCLGTTSLVPKRSCAVTRAETKT